jgi:hypothetical protein
MKEWLPRFATIGEPVSLEDLILFGDCYYLPHEEGPEAEAMLRQGGLGKEAKRLRDFCARMAELRDRSLFYALHRRVWELREELDFAMGRASEPGNHERLHHSSRASRRSARRILRLPQDWGSRQGW